MISSIRGKQQTYFIAITAHVYKRTLIIQAPRHSQKGMLGKELFVRKVPIYYLLNTGFILLCRLRHVVCPLLVMQDNIIQQGRILLISYEANTVSKKCLRLQKPMAENKNLCTTSSRAPYQISGVRCATMAFIEYNKQYKLILYHYIYYIIRNSCYPR